MTCERTAYYIFKLHTDGRRRESERVAREMEREEEELHGYEKKKTSMRAFYVHTVYMYTFGFALYKYILYPMKKKKDLQKSPILILGWLDGDPCARVVLRVNRF